MGFDNAYEEIHDPTRVEQWRIQPGTFIAFELDTEFVADRLEASCEAYPELLGKEAVRDVRVFPKGRYLGLVLWSHTYTVDASEDMGESLDDGEGSDGLEGAEVVEELVVNFVSPTPPPAPHQSRCVPIGTFASGSEHAPLQTTTLFPFPGMLQWTTFGTRLEVRSVCDSALHFKLKEDEFERFDERVADDYRASISKRLTQGCKDAEDEAIETLKVPTYTLPAKIWRDVREARRSSSLASAQGPCSLKEAGKSGVMHPVSFAEEVEALSRLIANYDAACCDALDSSVA
ncbi:hypothetical protein EUX98_g1764 [Antrodiella citrinella]|uniref:Uncharacterized protein n=1 Tax=Antrodiella citrinella TaxID=2447956 RepID=A0A4S4N2Z4_9APHY|nr:hypothetical protein EUX98_g1764 [Antrodiella citrinella]